MALPHSRLARTIKSTSSYQYVPLWQHGSDHQKKGEPGQISELAAACRCFSSAKLSKWLGQNNKKREKKRRKKRRKKDTTGKAWQGLITLLSMSRLSVQPTAKGLGHKKEQQQRHKLTHTHTHARTDTNTHTRVRVCWKRMLLTRSVNSLLPMSRRSSSARRPKDLGRVFRWFSRISRIFSFTSLTQTHTHRWERKWHRLTFSCFKSETERGPERSCRINTQGS